MTRLMLAFYLAFLTFGTGAAQANRPCPDMQRPFPAPVSEVAAAMAGWFTDQGYTVHQDFLRSGVARLTAWNTRNEWEIIVRPQSALAAVATVIHDDTAGGATACRYLREYVDGYLLEAMPGLPEATTSRPLAIPAAVLDHIAAAVCIRARSGDENVQFSGFVVDPEGLVLCTSHDLAGHQRVTITFHDGTSMPGEVVRLDPRRDLALIECFSGGGGFVPLSAGRNLLEIGESVFSIGCPNSLRGTLESGTISGSPRRVGDQPFWQVRMNIHPGSSGSPVFDAQGRLVAMVKGRYRGTSTIGFLIPLETIYTFLLKSPN